MKKTKPAAKRLKRKAEATPAPEVPDWLAETPIMEYTLEAFHVQSWQQIDLTLDEYDALKEHLAKLRGIEEPAEAAHA